jgi:hypothetical protein
MYLLYVLLSLLLAAAGAGGPPHGYLTSCSEKTQTTQAAILWFCGE